MMKLRSVAVVALCWSASAWAQTPPVTQTTQAYVPLTGVGVVDATVTARDSFGFSDALDEGYVTLPIPFAFPYFGATYNSVHIDSNGVLVLGSDASECTLNDFACYSGQGIPKATRKPHNVIAGWWADLDGATTGGKIRYRTSASDVVIEWSNFHRWGSSNTALYTWQMRLTASGVFQVWYGPAPTGAQSSSGHVAGFENNAGTLGAAFIPCATTAACKLADWPANQLFTVGNPPQPELVVDKIVLGTLAESPPNLSIPFTVTFRNYGQMPANNFLWKAYLSTDRALSVDDQLIYTAGSTASVAPGTTTDVSASPSITLPPPGQYFVIVDADTTNVVAEAIENNNTGATIDPFSQGVDLVSLSVSGPAVAGPGDMISVPVQYTNRGTKTATNFTWRVALSANDTFDLSDYSLAQGTRTLAPNATVTETLTVTVPSNSPPGDRFIILMMDPDGVLAEASETNNAVTGPAKIRINQPDLVNEGADFIDPITGSSTRVGNFGEAAKVQVKVRNNSPVAGGAFKVGIVVSKDLTLSLLSDTLVIEQPVASLAPNTVQTVDVSFTLPTNDLTNTPFKTGPFYIFAIVDSSQQVTEVSEQNNNQAVAGAIKLRAPAPDLTFLQVDAPASAAAGETIPVYRVLKNVGNLDAQASKYRYYLSANTIITPDDTPLLIVGANGMTSADGTVALARGASSSASELVRLPPDVTPGSYYVGCMADVGGVVEELDETNNGLASRAITIVPSVLRIVTTQLSDAVVDRPFANQLVATGENGVSTWSIDSNNGSLPAGLSLSADGLISGTPTSGAAPVSAFTVILSNAGRTATMRLALRVLPTTSQVDITTPPTLPPVSNNTATKYELYLGAAGGVKPYTWSIVAGTLPGNLALTPDGLISGFPRAGLAEGSSKITVKVQDSLGTTAQKELTVRVVAAGALLFRNLSLPDGLVREPYAIDISVANQDGSPLAKPLMWGVVNGALPDGLALTPQGDVALLDGKPQVAGNFYFTLEVTDAKGRSDTAEFLVRIDVARFKLQIANVPDHFRPGDVVALAVQTTSAQPANYTLYAGALPPGVTLAADGTIAGTVAGEGSLGTYDFVIEARDAAGATGLGAFTFRVQSDGRSGPGCSSAPGGIAGVLFLLPLFYLARRRRSLALTALLLAAPIASAQTYEMGTPVTTPFQLLPAGTSVGASTNVSLPFVFHFYGQSVTSVGFSQYGYLYLSGSATSFNQGIPHNSSFYNATFIAPWWDSFTIKTTPTTDSNLRYQHFGVAPRRWTTFEWRDANYSSTTTFSFQVTLYEGTDQVRLAYGPTSPASTSGSASVGIQKTLQQGISALSCTTATSGACNGGAFPAGKTIDFQLPPDLSLAPLAGDSTGYSGVSYRITQTLRNSGGRVASAVRTRFYLSVDTALDTAADTALGDSTPIDVRPYEDVLQTVSVTLPASLATGNYYVFGVVDPDGSITELNELNNGSPALPFSIGGPAADFVVSSATSPTTAAPGATVAVNRIISNLGNAAGPAFKYTYFLSDNAAVAISDRVLGSTLNGPALPAGQSDTATDMVTLPSDITSGKFWLGLCVNYDPAATPPFPLPEISLVNDCFTLGAGIVFTGAQLAITTSTLPPATQYAPFATRLIATGGAGSYAWSIASGALPPGISLSAVGDLSGSPSKSGTFAFEARVSSGTDQKTAAFSMQVVSGNIPLAIVDQDLPAAEFLRSYSAALVAVGGKPPYVWKLKDGSALPVGLGLAPDGTVEGRAAQGGTFSFSVELKDAAGTGAAKDLKLRVVDPPSLHFATSSLPNAILKKNYVTAFQAVGGKAPYAFSITRWQPLPENPTEKPGPVLEQPGAAPLTLPDSIGLTLDASSGKLQGVPLTAGLFAMRVVVFDAASAKDETTLLLKISYDEPLAITTTALPDAFVAHEYKVQLSHNGVDLKAAKFSLPCIQDATGVDMYQCQDLGDFAKLPAGLTLADDGTISGTAGADASLKLPATYSFLVKVTDESNRQDVRGLSIKLWPDYATSGGGCSSVAAWPMSFGILAALRLMRPRRRATSSNTDSSTRS